uniref:Putative class 2 transcription repressor nc2 alpha subunit drap1 n=1 Tax=Corethrella appendiculata TaxID=1370023 RepID=U5ERM8_9DIPT
MPSKKKKKFPARFPAGRIKKIMQTDEEIGKVAQAVPIIISRTLELFVESLLTKTLKITNSRNAKTLSPSHMKQCIISENRFDFLRDLVKNIPDISMAEEQAGESGDDQASTSTITNFNNNTTSNSNNNNNNNGILSNSTTILSRSESVNSSLHTQYPQQQQIINSNSSNNNNNKRPATTLNFYKELHTVDTNNKLLQVNYDPPPPKLTRLNSAPASTSTITTSQFDKNINPLPAIPFKIDILPNIQANPSSITPSTITNKLSLPSTSKTLPVDSVIKLDYTNIKLPMSIPQSPSTTLQMNNITNFLHQQQQQQTKQDQQPQIKIDLSNFGNLSSPTVINQNPFQPKIEIIAPSVPSTSIRLTATSSSPSSSSSSSSLNHLVKTPTTLTPILDEDYDNI